jgi:hypothetical protein
MRVSQVDRLGLTAESEKPGESANKRLLYDVFRLLIVQENASRDAIQISIVASDQNAKCPRVASSGQPEKFSIGRPLADLVRQDDLAPSAKDVTA